MGKRDLGEMVQECLELHRKRDDYFLAELENSAAFANYLVGHCKNIKSEYVKIVEENFLDLLA